MLDAREFIAQARRDISGLRKQALSFRLAGWAVAITGAILLLSGFIQACAHDTIAHRWQSPITLALLRITSKIWLAVDDLVPFWWRIIEALPFPKTLSPASNVSWYIAIAFYVVVALLAAILNHRSFRLKEAATEAKKRLAFHAPLLMQMSAPAAPSQSIHIGNVAGETVTISAANAVTQVIRDAEEKKWYERPWGLVLMGVGIAAASKLLHLT